MEEPTFNNEIEITKYALTHSVSHLVAAGRCKGPSTSLGKHRLVDGPKTRWHGNHGDCRLLLSASSQEGDRTIDLLLRAMDLSMAELLQDPRGYPGSW